MTDVSAMGPKELKELDNKIIKLTAMLLCGCVWVR